MSFDVAAATAPVATFDWIEFHSKTRYVVCDTFCFCSLQPKNNYYDIVS